ncbi:hypothetical protein [Halomonas huangheensis]|uniref:Tetratrico peptide repeat group 5 domain-containing protein n=1 Tax=Halomonas huangheensis TaxID=1178482 RepID=W1N1Q1_9GAMM|nr:hypothetical protein [Halomonas huangheensis]ERL49408.1 hypothetical protein BJB45_06410 [Halomonas huangheensis]
MHVVNSWRSPLRLTLLLLGSGVALPALAAPTLSGGTIRDLRALEQQMDSAPAVVEGKAADQAQRLAGGNASDRWAQALYLQLAAGAEASQQKYAEAADHLAEARSVDGVDAAQRNRWLGQEADLRLKAGQKEQGRELLGEWLTSNDGDASSLWQMAQLEAERESWESAADWVEKARRASDSPSADQLAFAAAVMQRSGRLDEALVALQQRLDQAADDPEAWRRAAGLAQKLGEPVRAAAIWEAGWRQGLLDGAEDLNRRIHLQLAAGTPARAAEILDDALAQGALPEDEEHLRLLAESWHLARDREQAMQAWQRLAEKTGSGADWLHLGQLASAWGNASLAREALKNAKQQGVAQAEEWQALLDEAGAAEVLPVMEETGRAVEPNEPELQEPGQQESE